MTATLDDATLDTQVQGLALTGYGAPRMRTLLLTVAHAGRAREFVGQLVEAGLLGFGRKERTVPGLDCTISIGMTYQGLRALGAPAPILAELRDRSPAFAEGARLRATRFLGDAGESAAERWDAVFHPDRGHVWISIHGRETASIDEAVAALQRLPGAAEGLRGWERTADLPDGQQLLDAGDSNISRVHFGFRDGITKPSILDGDRRIPQPGPDGKPFKPQPGELLLGYPNNDGADLWITERTPDDVADFLRNGSFGVLRKVQQYEQRLDEYLREQSESLQAAGHEFATPAYLKAKMCGRWPNGALVAPGETEEPPGPPADRLRLVDFKHDPDGVGCPFGAHIRRANPRSDPLMPPRDRALFRRGIPYGEPRAADAGLFGLFFCARIEDQFEHLVSEWLEKNPMGPPNRGRAKDPLTGHHDDPAAQFHIPLPDGRRIALDDFTAFVRTRGTLYALFPSRRALKIIAGGVDWRDPPAARPQRPAQPAPAYQAPESHAPEQPHPAAAAPAVAAAPPAPGTADPAAGRKEKAEPRPIDAPNDRFCDIVMEGGITSGVIYASAAMELARHYRFQSIGGSSIGAFAAALTAAAEYRRRHGSGDGFAALARLPQELAKEEEGRTLLERLFIPQPGTRRLFRIFLATLDHGGPATAIVCGLAAAVRQYLWPILLSMLALGAIVLAGPIQTAHQCWSWPPLSQCAWPLLSWSTAAALTLAVAAASALVVGITWDLGWSVVRNGFGLCRGWDPDAKPDSADLAAFLHGSIQRVAGRDPHDDPPLTFRDLWDAPGAASHALGFTPRGAGARSINLEVYSSNLSQGRPYRFPLDEAEDMGRLFFRVEELECYFPKGIVHYLAAVATPYAARSEADPPADQVGDGYLALPVADLPIVIAARLAMSFPLLISAVPLHAVNHRRRRIDRCWMSDGGLCSNFPIHLFDSFLPMWPTFGISLDSREKDDERRVWLPKFHTSGRADLWDEGPDRSFFRLGAFLVSLWKTTWRWNDRTMMRMPGVRDRVVRIYLGKGEGGINIRMRAEKVKMLGTAYGTAAAKEFIRKFEADGSRGWHEHRWVRLNCLLVSLRDRIRNFGASAALDRHATPLAKQIDEALASAPLAKPDRRYRSWPSEAKLDQRQVAELKALVGALTTLEDAFKQAGEQEPYRAIPRSSLRIKHPT